MDGMAMGGENALSTAYDWHLVGLSIVIACAAAYVALALAERVTENRERGRYLWLYGGALAMGSGIWSMHFTGMLAFHVPVAISYDIPIVALSLLAAVLASGIALYVVSRAALSVPSWLSGGVLMGGGIAAMHYIGMAAMRMPARAHFDPRIVALSLMTAIAVSLVALWLVFQLRTAADDPFEWRRLGASLVMGVAIAGMHYTGMAAATFAAADAPASDGYLVSAATLGNGAIALITLLVLALVLVSALFQRRFAAQETALVASQHHFRMVVANAPVILVALDARGTVTMAEGRDLAALGYRADAMIGRSFVELYRDVPALAQQARRALAGEALTAYGTVRGIVLETRWMPLRDEEGRVASVVAVATDITERRRVEVALKHQALHDALTDLPNRAFLNERLAEALRTAAHTQLPFCLALIDLDRFKEVNDTLGHHVGDVLLKEVATRLNSALRASDVAARLGGDEFAVLLPNAPEPDAVVIAQRILDALAAPYVVHGHSLEIRGSIGLAIYPRHGADPATLLRHADVAMYVAKRGKLGYAIYDAAQDRHSALH
jgi:diguanylate cyclase